MAIVYLAIYLFAIWIAGKASKLVGLSPIVAEIITGVLLGPDVGKLIPRSYALCSADLSHRCDDVSWLSNLNYYLENDHSAEGDACRNMTSNFSTVSLADCKSGIASGSTLAPAAKSCLRCYEACKQVKEQDCQDHPDFFTLLGSAGVGLMIFESGMHFDLKQIKNVGPPALAIATVGTLLPIGVGVSLSEIFSTLPGADGGNPHLAALATGVALAPTSVGIALKLLLENGSLRTRFGQIIIGSAFLDDVFSLMAFQILGGLQDGVDVWTFLPGILGILLVVIGAVLAVRVWPAAVYRLLAKVKDAEDASFQPRDNVLMLLMVTFVVGYSVLSGIVIPGGSHLWGCFVGGMSFSEIRRAHHTWVYQTKRVTHWLLRLFFAGTIAFSIPVEQLVNPTAMWQGALMGIFACVATKLLSGAGMGELKWIVGWAMCGRAEFAYFIAGDARNKKLLSPTQYVVVVWALLWATVLAPFFFSIALKKHNSKRIKELAGELKAKGTDLDQISLLCDLGGRQICFRVLIVKNLHNEDIDHEIHTFFHEEQLVVNTVHVRRGDDTFMGMFGVRARNVVVDVDFLTYLRDKLLKMFDNSELRVVFLPAFSEQEIEDEMVKVTAISHADSHFLKQMLVRIQLTGLTVVQSSCELHHPILVGGLTYYPHTGEHVFSAICQPGAKSPGRHDLVLSAAEQIKKTTKKDNNHVFVETIPYNPDPLHNLMRDEVAIDLSRGEIENTGDAPIFVRLIVTVDARVDEAKFRSVGALRNVFTGTCECLERNELGVILSRHDHMPLALVPTILIVAQWLKEDGRKVEELCTDVQNQLNDMLKELELPGEADVHMLDSVDSDGTTMPLHLGQVNAKFHDVMSDTRVTSDDLHRVLSTSGAPDTGDESDVAEKSSSSLRKTNANNTDENANKTDET